MAILRVPQIVEGFDDIQHALCRFLSRSRRDVGLEGVEDKLDHDQLGVRRKGRPIVSQTLLISSPAFSFSGGVEEL